MRWPPKPSSPYLRSKEPGRKEKPFPLASSGEGLLLFPNLSYVTPFPRRLYSVPAEAGILA